MAFSFLPLGYKVGQPINFNTLNLSQLSFNKLNADDYDWGWGDAPVDGLTGESVTEQAKVAAENGKITLSKVLTAIGAYTPYVLSLLQSIGAAKKSGSQIQIDENLIRDILQKTGGRLDPPAIESYISTEKTQARSATILGIPTSTAVIIIGIGLLYVIFKDDLKSKKKA